MESKKLLTLIITLVVGIILAGSLLMPVLSSYSDDTKTIENEGSFFATPDGENHTITFTDQNYATVDGVNVEYPEGFGTGIQKNATVMVGNDWMLRLENGYARLIAAGPNNVFSQENLADGLTATISGTTASITIEDKEKTLTDLQYYLAPEGDWVLCYNPYIKADTPLFGGIRGQGTNSDGQRYDCFEVISGNVTNGFDEETCRGAIFTTPTSFVTVDATYDISTETVATDLLKLNTITQNVTFSDNSTATVVISYLLAPATITYTNPDDLNQDALLSAIPIMVIVALLILAVRAIAYRD